VRVFGCAEDQILARQNVYETRITSHQLDREIQYPVKSLMEAIRRGYAADTIMQNV
jgi:hypothetical protein